MSLASQKLALFGVASGKMAVAVGECSDSKGMFIIMEEHVLGKKNHADVDPDVFFPPEEFRKPAHVMINKVDCTFKEGANCKQLTSDIWKRVIVDEVVDLRSNFGQTRQVKLGRSRKVQHYNYESIPVIEREKHAHHPSIQHASI